MKSSFFKVSIGGETRLVNAPSQRIAEEFIIGQKVSAVKVTSIAEISILARTHTIEFAHELPESSERFVTE